MFNISRNTFSNFFKLMKDKSMFVTAISIVIGRVLNRFISEVVKFFVILITKGSLKDLKSREINMFGRKLLVGGIIKSFLEAIVSFIVLAIVFQYLAIYV